MASHAPDPVLAARPAATQRVDRTARRAETAPLNAPITAAFIGLLLARELAWAEEQVAVEGGAGEGAGGAELPAAGAGVTAAGDILAAGGGAQLTSGGEAGPGADGVSVTHLAAADPTSAAFAGEGGRPGIVLDDDPMTNAITLQGPEFKVEAMRLGDGEAPPAEAELEAGEEQLAGFGYLGMIEEFQVGTAGDDVLIGTAGNDYISGLAGDDEIFGRAGDDVLHGDEGDDRVFGEAGNDFVFGDDGNDRVDGGSGSDLVFGGAGTDTLVGGPSDDWGFDNLFGGFDGDTFVVNHLTDVPDESYVADSAIDRFTVGTGFIKDFPAAKPFFTAVDSFDALPANLPAGAHVHVSAGIEQIVLAGDWDADIYGGGGANLLVGNAGDNVIKGFAGDDVLDGRGGTNRLEGGAGHDTYLVDTRLEGLDTIRDGDGADALDANTLRFKGADASDLAIARSGDEVTFELAGVLRAKIVGYDDAGPVFYIQTDDATFQLFDTNHAPRPAADVTTQWAVAEGGVGQYGLPDDLFVDVDLDDAVALSARLAGGKALPDWLSFDAGTGRFVAIPGQDDAGVYEVVITATDTRGATATTSFDLDVTPVNMSPQAFWPDADVIFREDAAAQPLYDLRPYFADADASDRLTFLLAGKDGTPVPEWLQLDGATGRLTGAPTDPLTAPLEVVVTASDGEQSASLTLTVGVEPAARAAPLAGADIVVAVEDGASATGNLLLNDLDPRGGTLAAELVGGPTHGTLELAADGAYSYAPDTDFSGDDVFWYRAVAADGTASAQIAVNVVVAATNDAPVVDDTALAQLNADLSGLGLEEEVSASLSLPASLFTDVDDASLDISAHWGSPDGLIVEADSGWLRYDPDRGTFDLAPGANDGGRHDVYLTARDAAGLTADVKLTLDVGEANAAPTVQRAYVNGSVDEGATLDLAPLTHFTDPDTGDALRLEVRLANGDPLPEWIVFDPTAATLHVTESGATAAFGHEEVNTLALQLRAVDRPAGQEGLASQWTDWRLDVVPLSDLLDTPAETITAFEDLALTNAMLTGRFATAAGAQLTATLDGGAALPAWLDFDPATGQFSGTPTDADLGPQTIRIVASDAAGHVDSESFKLVVEGTNDAPEVDPAAIAAFEAALGETEQGAEFVAYIPADLAVDPDGQAVDIAPDLASLPAWLAYDPPTGKLYGTPGNDDVGEVVIRFSAVEQGGAGLATGPFEVRFEVADVNDAPQASVPTLALAVDAGAGLVALAAADLFTDIDAGDTLTFALAWREGPGLPAGVTFDGGVLAGTPTLVGEHQLTLTATDGAGASAVVDIALVVTSPPHADDPHALATDGHLTTAQFDDESFANLWPMSTGTLFAGPGVSLAEVRGWDGLGSSNFMMTSSTGYHDNISLNGAGKAAVVMGDGDNIVLGNAGHNVLHGQGGADVLSGGAGDDDLHGGAGDDVLAGGLGLDRLYGEGGDDRYEIGGLNDGAVDTIFDADGANVVDFDGVDGAQMSFGMDGADLVIAVDGHDAARVDVFGGGEATFEVLADDASVGHAALLAAVEEMRAAFQQGERLPLDDVLEQFLTESAAPADPLAAFTTADAPALDPAPPASLLAADAADFVVPAGADTHVEAVSGIKGSAEDEQPTYA